ncbi:MAG: hypothetical protein E6560_09675 [Yersiniaceae bacterium]|nr:hypothetical protein [Yersiniaceae bacterium]
MTHAVTLRPALLPERWMAFGVTFITLPFILWTVALHAATFGGLPWQSLSRGFLYALPLTLALSAWAACVFSAFYLRARPALPARQAPGLAGIVILLMTALVLFWVPDYRWRFCTVVIGLLLIAVTKRRSPAAVLTDDPLLPARAWQNSALAGIMLIAVILTLMAYRSDYDDSHFIQLADQTLRHPLLVPLTFDTTLGPVYPHFRFAPYRIASYETFIAWLATWSHLPLFTVYYLLVPGISAALTVAVAFLFSRLFLPRNGAIVATALCVLLLFAWGESHIAYGNRVFVRLFQGKALLIALTTPLTAITGLLLLNRPTLLRTLPLAAVHIMTLGVSSSGLVLTVFTTVLVAACALDKPLKQAARFWFFLGIALIYPALFVFWLKFINTSGISLAEVGTYLPINASLGLARRDALALLALLLGCSVLAWRRGTLSYLLFTVTTLLMILNPWFADLLAQVSARNMSWRLAWAAPVPLLISTGLAAAMTGKGRFLPGALLGCAVLLAFLLGGRWTLSADNSTQLGWPSAKLPPQYQTAVHLMAQLDKLNLRGNLLTDSPVAAFVPLLKPDFGLVMPGHTYPVMLQTILPPEEFAARMRLFNAINSPQPHLAALEQEMRRFQVQVIIVNAALPPAELLSPAGNAAGFSLNRLAESDGYAIYRVVYHEK